MPYRLIFVFAIVIASALLMTSITSAQVTPILPASPGIEIEQPSRILDATTQSDSSLDPLPCSAGKASPPSNQPDTTITESRHRLDALEQPVLQLAEQVRAMEAKQGKDHAESIKLRTELRDLVQKTFAARQEIQRTELAEFSRRLRMMQQTIDARQQSVDRIVERRVEELLYPNLNWTHSEDERSPMAATNLSALSTRPPEPVVINQIAEDTYKVQLSMFEVSDLNFMKDREVNAEPFVAPAELDEEVKRMMDSKMAKMVGAHTLETIFNRTATTFSGGTFEVPASPGFPKRDVEFGTRITVRTYLQDKERIFEWIWSDRLLNRSNSVNGIPGVNEKHLRVVVKSPVSGSPGYLCGPFPVENSSDRRFIHFRLDGTADATPASTEQIGQSQDPLGSLQGEWGLEQLTEGGGENEGNHRRVTITKDLLNIYAETGELKTVFQLEVLNDKTVNAVLDPNGERLKLTGILEITAERFQLCLGADGVPPAVMAPGANVIYLSAKRPSDSTPDSTTSGSPATSAEFLKRLQGEWKCKVFNVEGETLSDPDAAPPIVRIEGAVASVDLKFRGVDEDYPSSKEPEEREVRTVWLLELVGSGTPQQVNLLVDPNGEKRQQYGIVECTEDRLRICVGAEDASSELNRPAIFAPGSRVIYLEAQRPTSQPAALPEGEELIPNTYLQ